jgi:predicted Zn-dependent protease
MNPMPRHFWGRALAVVVSAAFAVPLVAQSAAISQQEKNWEAQVGQARYIQFIQKGEIVPSDSPLYDTLRPIANKIAAVADKQYFTPFHFILVNERSPNAFSVPGGNVYVTTAMLAEVRNKDELAGVLCHEVNHDINHDVYNFYHLNGSHSDGPTPAYSRMIESKADRAGAYTCAKAGFNPWGAVWSFRQTHDEYTTPAMAALADHPSDSRRAADLVALFHSDKTTFNRYRDDVAASPSIQLPNMQLAQQGPSGYGRYQQVAPTGYAPQGNPSGYAQQSRYPEQGAPSRYAPAQATPQPGPPQDGASTAQSTTSGRCSDFDSVQAKRQCIRARRQARRALLTQTSDPTPN